jgi:hypothetical protein
MNALMTDSIDVREPTARGLQRSFFRVTDNIPEEAWY